MLLASELGAPLGCLGVAESPEQGSDTVTWPWGNAEGLGL